MILLSLLACARPLPEHLRVPTSDDSVDMPDVAVSDLGSAIAATIGKDPLTRSPTLLPESLIRDLSGTRPLLAFYRSVRGLEQGAGTVERSMQLIEDEWTGTVAVPLARGYRLRIAENRLTATITPASAEALLPLLTPVQRVDPASTGPRSALAWLADEPTVPTVRRYADRWVLSAWLAGPDIPTAQVATLLEAPQYDGLRASPTGALIAARHGSGELDEQGFELLRRATRLALEEAAADRDREQAAWAQSKADAAEELGAPDPIGALLESARTTLTSSASHDAALGGALLAFSAQRWRGSCPQEPCRGLDRVETMTASGRWDPSVQELASIWRVIALKSAMDTLEVGRDTVLFPRAMAELVDALIGSGAGPIPAALLQKQRGDGTVWLGVSRAVGADGSIEWEGVRLALGQHLQGEVDRAGATTKDQQFREWLGRIRKRAIP